jgi:hypothetical protein
MIEDHNGGAIFAVNDAKFSVLLSHCSFENISADL